MIDIFIPSYHRPENIKTVKYFVKIGYPVKNLHVLIDDAADDIMDYQRVSEEIGFNLYVFNMEAGRDSFDFVHRPSKMRRSAGLSRNMIYEVMEKVGVDFCIMMDDDTAGFDKRPFGVYYSIASYKEITDTFELVRAMMEKHRIGCFGLSQTGEMFQRTNTKLMRKKVMNTTFIDKRFIYRGEKGQNDPDTSQFVGIMNEGYFTGSMATGIVLHPTISAAVKGGLTEQYNEIKLLSKAMIIPIQFPSLSRAEKQERNGGRLHHRINYRNLYPYLMKGERSNIAWDTYPEDVPFTLEPKRKLKK